MKCRDVLQLLYSYSDGELDLVRKPAVDVQPRRGGGLPDVQAVAFERRLSGRGLLRFPAIRREVFQADDGTE